MAALATHARLAGCQAGQQRGAVLGVALLLLTVLTLLALGASQLRRTQETATRSIQQRCANSPKDIARLSPGRATKARSSAKTIASGECRGTYAVTSRPPSQSNLSVTSSPTIDYLLQIRITPQTARVGSPANCTGTWEPT